MQYAMGNSGCEVLSRGGCAMPGEMEFRHGFAMLRTA